MTTKIYITATSTDPDTMESSSGWIDPEWSMTQLHDDKKDVRYLEVDDEDTVDVIEDIIFQTIGDYTVEDSPRGETYNSSGAIQDSATGLYWSYCAHVES